MEFNQLSPRFSSPMLSSNMTSHPCVTLSRQFWWYSRVVAQAIVYCSNYKEICPEVHEATTTKRTRFGATPNLMAGTEACDGKRTKNKMF